MKTLHITIITVTGIIALALIGSLILISPHSILLLEKNPICNDAPNPSRDTLALKNVTTLSVIEIEKNQTKLDCTSVNHETLLKMPKLEQALVGASQCKQGKDDICYFASGVGLVMIPLNSTDVVPIEDIGNYQTTLTQDETNFILDNVRLASNGNLVVGDIKYNSMYYQIMLSTTDEPGSSQVNVNYTPEPNFVPVDLSSGKSVNYTLTAKTLATFGIPAKVQLYPIITAQDSGLTARIVPDMLSIQERSKANATMIITAGSHAQNGTYQIGFNGKISNGGFAGGIRQDPCPCVRIGGSDWTIRTYGSNGFGGMGGNQPPQWLRFETVTDKHLYHQGETVEIKNFIINDSPNKITLENGVRMFVNMYNQVNDTGSFHYFYGVDAIYDGKPIILEPHSKIVLARPFYWDQSDLRDQSVSHKVVPGNYHVDASFGSYDGAVWDNDIPITIK